ncbi:MAG: Crp/Fnr family transcriptional regulator [Chromatiales bacterium]|nr:Crp/Fnr family transcriptional regulator [Chromatiales bacterium]
MLDAPGLRQLTRAFSGVLDEDEDLRDQLASRASLVTLPAGATICNEGDICSTLALVLEGVARVYKLGETGRELSLYRIYPGESCILTASCILSLSRFPAIAVAETPLVAAVVPATDVREWLSHSVSWRNYVFRLIAQRVGAIIAVVEEVAFKRVDRRIGELLLARCADQDSLAITHQAIADELGTAREVVTRILRDLELRGALVLGRGIVSVIDRDLLVSEAGG